MAKKFKSASLDDPFNATTGVPKRSIKGTPTTKPMDTVHVKSDLGYPMAVGRNSKYDIMAKEFGAVPNNLRPGGGYTENTDPLAVKNFKNKAKMRKRK